MLSAVQLNTGTIINTSITNTTLSFEARNITAETVIIEDSNITLSGVSYQNGTLIFNNFTTPLFFNHINSNIDSVSYPTLTTDSRGTKVITSQLTQTLNASITANITESCDNLYQVNYVSSTGAYTQTYTKHIIWIFGDYECTNSVITGITIKGIEIGNNNLNFLYNYDRTDLFATCKQLTNGFNSFGDLLTLIVLAVIMVIVIGMFANGTIDFRGFLISSVLIIVFVGIINIFGAVIIGYLC